MRNTEEKIQNNPNYLLLDKLQYDSIAEFATQYLRKRTRTIIFYIALIIFLFVFMWAAFIYGVAVEGRYWVSLLKQFLYGLVISLTIVIPIHELVHAIGYFMLGARKIRFGAILKHFAFYAVADDFIVGRKRFIFLALAPFIVVSGLNIWGIVAIPGYAAYTYISVLFFHATMCAGDFALMSYFETHRDKKVYTFDDVKNKTSYFYYRKK